jgi:hypothetical protein
VPTKEPTAYEFGAGLLRTNDLDPVYVAVHRAGLPRGQLNRWLLAYWCFYHVGTAGWVAAQPGYWDALLAAARSKNYPRSSERRYYRGRAAETSVLWLRARGLGPLLLPILGRSWDAGPLTAHVKTWRGFGPWIAFKVADMVERLGLARVRFDAATAMYLGSPAAGAALLWEREGRPCTGGRPVTAWAAGRVVEELAGYTAPPRHERPVGVQEAETVLCKWKSHLGGHYHVGKDVHEVRVALGRFPGCPVAARLLEGGREGGLW